MLQSSKVRFELVDVSVDFGTTQALRGVSLAFGSGEQLALVGPSGAGKTTLLRLLNGSLRPSRGEVRVEGAALDELPPADLRRVRSDIGFVHQSLSLVPTLSVLQNVLAGHLGRRTLTASLRSFLLPRRREVEEVYRLLARVGIGEKLFERTERLSGGQRQRVAIARALYQGGRAILADEPVSSVDPARARNTVELLSSLCRERGLTLCVSLHNLDLARECLPRLVGMRSGRVVFDGPSGAIEDEQFASLYQLDAREMLVHL